MLGKITDAAPSVRRNTILYLVGRAAVLAAVLLTLADIVRVYMAYGTEIAVGMMIPRMGALLGFSGSGVAGVLCTAVAFLFVIATALSVALAGRWYAWSIVALVLFSLDTLVTRLAVCSVAERRVSPCAFGTHRSRDISRCCRCGGAQARSFRGKRG